MYSLFCRAMNDEQHGAIRYKKALTVEEKLELLAVVGLIKSAVLPSSTLSVLRVTQLS